MSGQGIKWTPAELALAIRLVCKLGYQFEQAGRIMARHGYVQRIPDDISEKLKLDAPNSWVKISQSQKARKLNTFCGIPAPPPPRRFQKMPDRFMAFMSAQRTGQSAEEICWVARNSDFDCNITDVEIAGTRIGYEFKEVKNSGVSFSKAVDNKKCLWPIGDDIFCGEDRSVKKYCSAHYCRSLG